jgi:uncharacterized protein (DUF169 family)
MCFQEMTEKFLESFGVDDLVPSVVPVGVKFFPQGTSYPREDELIADASIPWCGAIKLASEGEVVVVTKKNIGCPAAAITLGLIDKDEKQPLEGDRKYTSLMEHPAAPADFTNGYVYACKDSGRMEFSLFGKDDSGRYKTLGASLNAISGMKMVENRMDAIIAFPYNSAEYTPDVVILGLTPKQALRAIQGYAFESGERIEFNTIGIRGVCADVTAYPFLEQKLNASLFCLGARALSGWDGNRLSFGMPYHVFKKMAEGMAESKTGFPYRIYP